MACSIIKTDQDDISELEMQEDIQFLHLNKIQSKIEDKTIQLERGGVIIKTGIGNIQFGMPPETVKDVINQKLDIPVYYIIPTDRFDKKYGINVAEFEFPAYFNFFVKKRKINLILSEEAEKAIRIVFQETLLGPVDHPNLEKDFTLDYPKESYPNFRQENKIFSVNENDPNDKGLTIDTLLNFIQYDKKTNTATIKQGDTTIQVQNEDGQITIIENGMVLEKLIDNVHLSQQNTSHLVSSFDILAQKQQNEMHLIQGHQNQFTIQELSDDEDENLPSDNSIKYQKQTNKTTNKIQAKSEQSLSQKNINRQPLKRNTTQCSGIINRDNIQQDVGVNKFIWTSKGGKTKQMSTNYSDNIIQPNETFTPPDFGITILGASHGFDPNGNTSGFIVWVYGKGIMVDPPPFASSYLKKMGIQTNILIKAIIISHCHADHDAGTFHKVLDDSQIEIITTRTIMDSFLKKYSALSKMSREQLQVLYTFRPVQIGAVMNIHGAQFKFFYSLHTIPCIGFECKVQNKSMYFSADTFYDPKRLQELAQKGMLSQNRFKQLAYPDFESQDVILHEAGVPPIHTPQTVLQELPSHIKNKLYLIHIAQKDLIKNQGLKIVGMGVENTLIILPSNNVKNMETKKRIELLSNIDILQSLTIKSINWLLDALQVEKYNSGDLICEEGTLGDKFYIIESGVARIFSLKKENPQQLKFERFFSTGDYFGESSLLASSETNSKRQASVEALTDLVVLTLEKNDFWFVFGNGSDGPGKVIQKFYNLSSSRMYKVNSVLQKNSVFQELTPGQKTQLEMILTLNEAKKGDIIWEKDNPVTFSILIKKGAFQFFNCDEDEELVPGYFVSETKAMIEKSNHVTSVKCVNKGQYFTIKKNDLLRFLKKNPGLNVLFRDILFFD